RTHLTTHPDNTLTLTLADHNGTTIGHINTLTLRTITPDQLSAPTSTPLYALEWVPSTPSAGVEASTGDFHVLTIPTPGADA
ncbi:hypothetical protein, partial [Streptomyces sp. JWR5-1]|uniref:hypothetical protein n=1 Tax=Streptomyces sp. JWR5-1 TaxID=3122053 RepID=UPI003018BAFD